MKHRQKFQLLSLSAVVILLLYPPVLWSQSLRPAEVNLRGANLAEVQDRLSGPNGLLNQNQPFELKAQNVVLTPRQAQDFFAPASGAQTPTSGTDFATLVGKIQQLPGTEVRIRGVVEAPGTAGTVQRIPFDAKIEAGEVKIKGLSLTQAQFDSLVSRLQATAGTRELKVEALVDGRRVETKFENEGGKLRTKVETRGREEERRHRGEHGTSATINNDRATDQGKDFDHEVRGRDRAVLERERVERRERGERPEREGVERREKVDRVERPERVDRAERPERVERPERPERLERPERH